MNISPSFAAKLAHFHKTFVAPSPNKKAKFNEYADLGEWTAAVRTAAAASGLLVMQPLGVLDGLGVERPLAEFRPVKTEETQAAESKLAGQAGKPATTSTAWAGPTVPIPINTIVLDVETGEMLTWAMVWWVTVDNALPTSEAQQMGIAITYGRRQALKGLLNDADDDNDADKPGNRNQQQPGRYAQGRR